MTQNQPEPRFDYFMLRVSRSEHEPDLLEGQVERLGSGEKRRFESGDERASSPIGGSPSTA